MLLMPVARSRMGNDFLIRLKRSRSRERERGRRHDIATDALACNVRARDGSVREWTELPAERTKWYAA